MKDIIIKNSEIYGKVVYTYIGTINFTKSSFWILEKKYHPMNYFLKSGYSLLMEEITNPEKGEMARYYIALQSENSDWKNPTQHKWKKLPTAVSDKYYQKWLQKVQPHLLIEKEN